MSYSCYLGNNPHVQISFVIASFCSSYSGQEVRYSHGSGGLIAPLHTAVLAERYVGASVNQRLVGVVVVREQALLELALVMEDCLERTERQTARTLMSCSRTRHEKQAL